MRDEKWSFFCSDRKKEHGMSFLGIGSTVCGHGYKVKGVVKVLVTRKMFVMLHACKK